MKYIILAGGAIAILLAAAGTIALKNDPAAERRKVFEQTWRIASEKFYDRSMKGLDWPAVRKTYLLKLRETDNTTDLYWKVLGPMLALLEISHVGAISPSDVPLNFTEGVPEAAMPAANVESCGGVMIAMPRRFMLPRAVSVDSQSFLRKSGISAGWRLIGWELESKDSETKPALEFLTTAAERVTVQIPVAAASSADLNLIRKDFATLNELRVNGSSAEGELKMHSIGLTVLIGKNVSPPQVVDVVNGSEAERAGVEPGSTITRMQRKNGVDGVFAVDATLTSTAGKTYSTEFKFRMCDVPDRDVKLLPGNVMVLRFDRFEPSIVPWLDEQLRAGPRVVVLDLRRNQGGRVAVMQDVLGRFFDAGTPVAENFYADNSEVVAAAMSPQVFRGPVSVLISQLSTSAAEVSAGAFKFHKRATLYGQGSGGDVLVSNSFRLADGGVVQVAIADMRGPDGKRLENVGVKVDHEILPTLETVRAGRDVVLEAALADLPL